MTNEERGAEIKRATGLTVDIKWQCEVTWFPQDFHAADIQPVVVQLFPQAAIAEPIEKAE